MTYKTPSGTKKCCKVLNQKVTRQPKCSFFVIFFYFFLVFFLRWASWKLCESFMIVLHKTAAFYSEQCTSPSLFHNFEVLSGTCNWNYPLKNYGFICNATFFTCTHVHKALRWQTVSRKGEQFSLPCSYDPSQAGKSFIWKRDLVIPQDVKAQLTPL